MPCPVIDEAYLFYNFNSAGGYYTYLFRNVNNNIQYECKYHSNNSKKEGI